MKPHEFQILLALSEGPLHGTAIARRVRELTDDAMTLWPVTLHRSLDRLNDSRLIAPLSAADHPQGESRRRRFYRLTAAGAQSLAAEAEALQSFADVARQNLRSKSWRSS